MTLDNMTGITKGSYTGFCKSQLITCNRVKECNGVCPFEDALKHADKTQTMNEQHTVDHDRDWIIGCIEHDGFIHTDRFDKANQIIHDALSADADGEDLIIKGAKGIQDGLYNIKDGELFKYKGKGGTVRTYPIVPSADAEQTDCTDFVNWLTEVVMDEGNWELNAVAYGEIICRKLEKLGVLEVTEEPSYYIRPSAEPTVIRSKTLLPTKDFKEWAKRVRETNPNAVVIPCDAEVVSADAVSREFYEDAVKANIGIVIENRKLKAQLESADAVQGEWKIDEYGIYHCPFCHAINNTVYKSFCPNCGANMKGGAK